MAVFHSAPDNCSGGIHDNRSKLCGNNHSAGSDCKYGCHGYITLFYNGKEKV